MWTLVKTMMMKEWLDWKRYPFNLISAFVSIYAIFLVIFLGYRSFGYGQPGFGKNIEGLIVGFSLWTFSIGAYSTLSWGLMNEARAGTLEQLYMCPRGFKWLTILWIIANFLLTVIFVVSMLILLMITTGHWLHIDVISLLPLSFVTLGGVYGIGYMTGGAALLFKRVQAFFQILQFVFIAFIAAPVDKHPLLKLLPLALGNHLIGKVMITRTPLWKLPPGDLILLLVVSSFYFFVGLLLFSWFEKKAKEKGLLGQY